MARNFKDHFGNAISGFRHDIKGKGKDRDIVELSLAEQLIQASEKYGTITFEEVSAAKEYISNKHVEVVPDELRNPERVVEVW